MADQNKVDLSNVNKTKRKIGPPRLKNPFKKQKGPARDTEGKFTAGSGSLKSLNFNWKRALPLVLVVAIAGGFLVYRGFAGRSTGYTFEHLHAPISIGTRLVTETRSSKRNARVVEVANGANTTTGRAVYRRAIEPGRYEACLGGVAQRGTPRGNLSARSLASGAVPSLGQKDYIANNSTEYGPLVCIPINLQGSPGTSQVVEFTITNTVPNSTLRISTILLDGRIGSHVHENSVTNPSIPTVVKWHDNIQTESNWRNWGPGFYLGCGISTAQQSDCFNSSFNGGSLARTPDPAGGGGFAIRHQIPGNEGRAQYSMASWTNSAFGAAAATNEVWIEWEVYFPQIPTIAGSTSWLSIMDFHSHGSRGEEWWATNPGLLFASQALGGTASDQGKLRIRDNTNTKFSNISAQPLPANRWVKLLVHYNWSTSEVPITLYVDGVQAMQLNAVTKRPVHNQLEFMVKLYGAGTWSPNPITYYSKNVKILDFE